MAVEKFVGPWITVYRCAVCDKVLSWEEVMNSFGTCPYCGEHSTNTIVRCCESARRKVYTYIPPWWKFWEKEVWHWENKKKQES